jgi:malate dehydrogenase (oxaloacetate-decarboxylating)
MPETTTNSSPDAASTNWLERYHAALMMTIRVRMLDKPGTLAHVLEAIAGARSPLGDIKTVGATSRTKTRDIQIYSVDREHLSRALAAIETVPNAEVLHVTDEVLEIHCGGTIETTATVPLDSIQDLRMVYTPGVASVCSIIEADPGSAWTYTAKGNKIAIATNGTAVLGLGDIGALAGLPVMEGKAAILAHYVGVSAEPMLIDEKDPGKIIDIIAACASGYGAIQLEDIAAPACFEIETTLQEMLDVPVFHDDQHGTATVCIAGLINALKQTGRTAATCRAVVLGAGAAGIAIARFLVDFGLEDVVLCDSHGAITPDRSVGMNPWKIKIAEVTNPSRVTGTLAEVMAGRDLFIGVSRPNLVTKAMVASMAKDPIVFALANPVSEISAEDARAAGAAVALDGRGMNNALAYPGIFRGTLDARAKRITHAMKFAAATTLAESADGGGLLPEMTDMAVHQRVAAAVEAAAGAGD